MKDTQPTATAGGASFKKAERSFEAAVKEEVKTFEENVDSKGKVPPKVIKNAEGELMKEAENFEGKVEGQATPTRRSRHARRRGSTLLATGSRWADLLK